MEFDWVIVGGGTAGSVLANRLSADPKRSVCLIEAGGPAHSPFVKAPLGVNWLLRHRQLDWGFSTVPQTALDHREIMVPRGKALGGSTAINGMVYIRGFPSDFDHWRDLGCTGWGYEDILPYFRKTEANDTHGAPDHGTDGEVPVTHLRNPHPVVGRFVEAARGLQLPMSDDLAGSAPEGIGRYQNYTRNGQRVTVAEVLIDPIVGRDNLNVLSGRTVLRLIIKDGRAAGVETTNGPVSARAGVILAAGAIGTPKLLMLSGIGPGAHLREHGLEVLRDVPAIGDNYHDHPNVMTLVRAKGPSGGYGLSLRRAPWLALDALNYIYRRRGMWASMLSEAGGFLRTGPDQPEPDVQFHFVPFWRSTTPGRVFARGHGFALHVCKLRPESRGTLRLASANPQDAPLIDPAMLSDPRDMDTMVAGVKLARRIANAPPLSDIRAYEALPGEAAQSDEDIRAFLRARTGTIFHPVGSCRMGTDADAPVDPQLRFRGIEALHVADASVMPRIVSGNTNAAVMMIAEKAADMIAAA